MSLKAFHVVFISASAVLAFGFGAWCLVGPTAAGSGTQSVAGLVSLVLGAGLLAYAAWFVRKMRVLQ